MIERLGQRWTLLTLRTLDDGGTLRFNELQRRIEGGISERMLAATLHDLESAGLVRRTLYPEVPPRVDHSLTGKYDSLRPILDALLRWAHENTDDTSTVDR